MRLWSLHPSLLDRQGLIACWREALLAQAVILGRTRGYTRHPQLERFRAHPDPVGAVGAYLLGLHEESLRRGYRFDAGRIAVPSSPEEDGGMSADGPAEGDPAGGPSIRGSAAGQFSDSGPAAGGLSAGEPSEGGFSDSGPSDSDPSGDDLAPGGTRPVRRIPVTTGQLELEWSHLLGKLATRSPEIHAQAEGGTGRPSAHPLFTVVSGDVESWERSS